MCSNVKRGELTTDITRALDLGESTLRTIHDSAEKIKESAKSGTLVSAFKPSYSRSLIKEQMLITWIKHQTDKNVPISMPVKQAKVWSILYFLV
ncbi:CENPB DNA-binding domain containing protein 1-like 42 [Homarus americanus]|uniref:CENPB DNA-binding domain containing protein 1-like 42 n=1 Tax=Homarus americanus TaxID=6706 RepID=A0A8J5MUE0_HOMAM|nr:CENPB DNA-binding domain containing protein 1-like 42 [Homarus americanus]